MRTGEDPDMFPIRRTSGLAKRSTKLFNWNEILI